MSLGAASGRVVWLFVREGVTLALAGVVVGLGAAAVVAPLLASSLFGIGAIDPLTFIIAAECCARWPRWRAISRREGVPGSTRWSRCGTIEFNRGSLRTPRTRATGPLRWSRARDRCPNVLGRSRI